MGNALRVGVALVALVILVRTLISAVRTFVVPRDEPTAIARAVFVALHWPFELLCRGRDAVASHRIMRLYAPIGLLLLPMVWVVMTWLSFGALFWALDAGDWQVALQLSGAAITSLGSSAPPTFGTSLVFYAEASLGLGLVALLITYLPTIYGAYQRREREVALLEVRAGSPPSAVEMLSRFHLIGFLGETSEVWTGWEEWFVDIEESHVSLGALVQFRSGAPEQSWVTASGAVLDGAAMLLAAVDVEHEPRATLCLRAGYLALRHVADFYDIEYDVAPRPDDPISISRAEFEAALDELAARGVPLKADRDQAWRDFAGWRVNYDRPLLGLCALVGAPAARWSSDRVNGFHRPPVTRRGGRGRGSGR